MHKKKTSGIWKWFRIFALSSALLWTGDLSLNAETVQNWIILPDIIRPYTSPTFNAERSDIVFKYMEQIRESSETGTPFSNPDWVRFECESQQLYLPKAYLVESASLNSGFALQDVDKNHTLPLSYVPEDLVTLDQKWNFHDNSYPKLLREKAAEALVQMFEKAEQEGVYIRVFSAFRSSEKQRSLYLNAVEQQGIRQSWVAKPGQSEHQLGTTVDLCGLDPRNVGHQNFSSSKEGQWLKAHAEEFGFKLSYTPENAVFTGYQSEPWHFRFRNY